MAEPRLLSLRAVTCLALGVMLAAASALAAYDSVNERRASIAVRAGELTPGFALSHRAMSLIATHAEIAKDGSASVPPDMAERARALSEEALQREPLNAAALRNLALLEPQRADGPDAQAMLLLAERLTRRDRRTNVLLAQEAALGGDLDGTVARLDHALRTSTSARREMLPLLYQALEQPGADRVIAEMLAGDVNWEGDFWASAATHRPALEQLANLRIARAEAGYGSTARDDRRLLKALVDARQFAAAEALSDRLHATDSGLGGAIRNGEFARLPEIGAFAWELHFDDAMTTEILPGQGVLRIRTYSAGGGLAARQLVAMPQQRYRLAVQGVQWEERDSETLRIALRCAESEGSALRWAVADARSSFTFAKPSPQCRYFWLELLVSPQPDRRENTVLVESISLKPLAEEPQ